MKEATGGVQELEIKKLAENIITSVKSNRVKEVESETLHHFSFVLREALVKHLSCFDYLEERGGTPATVARAMALLIAKTEDMLQSERNDGALSLGCAIEDSIVTFSCVQNLVCAIPTEESVDASTISMLLRTLYDKAVDDIYKELKDYIILPKMENQCPAI